MKYIKTIVAGLLLTYINNYGSEKINVNKITNERYALHNPSYNAFNNVLYDLSKQKDIVAHSIDSYKLFKNLYIEKLEEGLLTNKRNLHKNDLISYTKLKNGPFFRYIEPKIQEAINNKKKLIHADIEVIYKKGEQRPLQKCAYAGNRGDNNKYPEVFEISIEKDDPFSHDNQLSNKKETLSGQEKNLSENLLNFFVKQTLIFPNNNRTVAAVTVKEHLEKMGENLLKKDKFIEEISKSIVGRVVNKENVQNSIDSNNLDLIGVPNNKYLMYLGKNEWVTIAEKVELEEVIEVYNLKNDFQDVEAKKKFNKEQIIQLYKILRITGYNDLGLNATYWNGLFSNIRIEKNTGKIMILDTDWLAFLNKKEIEEKEKKNVHYFFTQLTNFLQKNINDSFKNSSYDKIFSVLKEDLESIKGDLKNIEEQNKNIKHKLVDESLVKSNMYNIFKQYYYNSYFKKLNTKQKLKNFLLPWNYYWENVYR